MQMIILTIATALLVLWSLWIRRYCWTCRWERATNIGLACLATANLVVAPTIEDRIDPLQHSITHIWNLDFYLSPVLTVSGICAIVYNAVAKLSGDEEMHRWAVRWLRCPCAAGTAVMTLLFLTSPEQNVDYALMYYVTNPLQSANMQAFYLIYGLLLIYLFYHGTKAFIDLWYDKASRSIVNIYLVGGVLSVLGVIIGVLMLIVLKTPFVYHLTVITWSLSVCAFAVGAVYSWRSRVRWFTHPTGEATEEHPLVQ
jgi:hypothetical protein